ncbi:RecQ family ATP-dependent DNA helicase [Aureispira anguillae]|uniref:ATP-dependent DNA helicase RecQ n=1 Tax=Aureispira anguillae TaxID=2864201 RepID=A0A915YCW8_9BACT|nr:ATP-dependent DNA helicase RecQ [Aureispira anguillae]BDS10762.1 RecQ family ATP-dependent DNA helicase [Aureispira anguillae]
MNSKKTRLTPHEVLKKYWGYDDFRPLQLDIVQSVLDGKDTLALLPTGGGKSICFQVPALCLDGICIVVSPLIALMKDQVKNLVDRGIRAYAIYSGMKIATIDRILDNCIHGGVDFLYLSPERLSSDLAIERIKQMKVTLLAVDEAHCISQWGYDFRPSYLNIAEIRALLPNIPLIALTATATRPVVKDIQEKLVFSQTANVFQKSFARQNLSYVVLYEENKRTKMLNILRKIKGSGIVYVQNRRETQEVAYFLKKNGISAEFYHAGRSGDTREKVQENWINNKVRIMVATNAFGMGIDKPDVRIVIHLTLPDSLEAYFQEAGRGGRDGEKAFGILLYNQSDRIKQERNFKQSYPTLKEIRRVYQALGSYYQLAIGAGLGQTFDLDVADFAKTYNLNPIETLHALKILMKEEYLNLTENVFFPSTLQVIVRKEELYDYMLRNNKIERLIKVILRSYQGAFNHDVNIREGQLAHFLKVPQKQLVFMLDKLHKDAIIRYKPQKDAPQLTFLLERLPEKEMVIDQQRYKFLKERQQKRMEGALYYAETLQCRNQLLLAYFDEKGAKVCGHCDVCLGRHDQYVKHQEYYEIKTKLEYALKKNSVELRALVDQFPSTMKEKVLKAIEHLMDNHMIVRTGNNQLRWN